MPSRSHDSGGWDFSRVLDLIESDSQDVGSTRLLPRTKSTTVSPGDTPCDGEKRLGSFSKLWQELGVSEPEPLPAMSPPEPDSEVQTDSEPAPDAGTKHLNDEEKAEEVADDSFAGLTKKQRSKARKRAEKARKDGLIAQERYQQAEKEREIVLMKLQEDVSGIDRPTRKGSEGTTKKIIADTMWQRALSRSNVGAKLRPVTPPPYSIAPDSRIESEEPIKALAAPYLAGTPTSAPKQSAVPVILKRPSLSQSSFPKATAPAPDPRGEAEGSIASRVTPLHLPASDAPKKPSVPVLRRPSTPQASLTTSTPNPVVTKAQYTTVGTPARPQTQYPFPQINLVPRTVRPAVVPRTAKPPVTPQMFQSSMLPGIAQAPVTPRVLQSPIAPGISQLPVTPARQPKILTVRPRVDRHFQFLHQLMRDFPDDTQYLVAPMQLCNEKTSTEGIHVFVDSSNIMYGFRDALRAYRVQGYEMSFDSLVLLMERRRPVAKRVYAGSHRESAPHPHVTKLVETSKAIGYENIVNEQVLISREESDKKKFFRSVKKHGWDKATKLHSGSGSDDPEMETPLATPAAPKWVEQGVDEIIHLKMCQSIIDTDNPTTMVLATGDGAEAEHSDGFLAHVERALKKGWKVELVSWKQQTNGGYKNKKFREKWGEQFKIFHLDAYIESLIDTP